MELKSKLSRLRKEKGLTQQELAEALHVSRQTVSRWEVGASIPTLENLVYLSELYQVPLNHLVQDGTPSPRPASSPPDRRSSVRARWRTDPAPPSPAKWLWKNRFSTVCLLWPGRRRWTTSSPGWKVTTSSPGWTRLYKKQGRFRVPVFTLFSRRNCDRRRWQ